MTLLLLSQLQLRQLRDTALPRAYQQPAGQQQQEQQQGNCQGLERQQAVGELAPALSAVLAAGLARLQHQPARELLLQLAAAVAQVLRVLLLPDEQLGHVLQLVGGGGDSAMADAAADGSSQLPTGLVQQAAELVGRAGEALQGVVTQAAAGQNGSARLVEQAAGGGDSDGCSSSAVAVECALLAELCCAIVASLVEG
uniref:Uncharacterized protein n=1 Tax=Tetradesmus obliquus TaxID=3088 RepID=A0A383VB48_TETOB